MSHAPGQVRPETYRKLHCVSWEGWLRVQSPSQRPQHLSLMGHVHLVDSGLQLDVSLRFGTKSV